MIIGPIRRSNVSFATTGRDPKSAPVKSYGSQFVGRATRRRTATYLRMEGSTPLSAGATRVLRDMPLGAGGRLKVGSTAASRVAYTHGRYARSDRPVKKGFGVTQLGMELGTEIGTAYGRECVDAMMTGWSTTCADDEEQRPRGDADDREHGEHPSSITIHTLAPPSRRRAAPFCDCDKWRREIRFFLETYHPHTRVTSGATPAARSCRSRRPFGLGGTGRGKRPGVSHRLGTRATPAASSPRRGKSENLSFHAALPRNK